MENQSLPLPGASSSRLRKKNGSRVLILAIVLVSLASFAVLGLFARSLLTYDSRPLESVEDRDAVRAVAQAEANPRDANVQLAAANACVLAGDDEEAVVYADRAIKLQPASIDAKLVKAKALQAGGDLKQARKLLEEIRKGESQASVVYANASLILAVIDEAEGKLEKAIENLNIAQTADPTNADRLVHIGQLQERVGEKEDAAASYGAALEYVPDLEPALTALRAMKSGAADYELSKAAWRAGNEEEAQQLMERAAQESPEVPWIQVALGEFRAMTGDKEGARSAFEAALSLEPGNEGAKAGLDSLK